MKLDKKIHSVWTTWGKVNIKRNKNESALLINSMQELNIILKSNTDITKEIMEGPGEEASSSNLTMKQVATGNPEQ